MRAELVKLVTLLVKQETESGDDSQEFCVNCVSYGDDNNKRNLKSLITILFHLSVSPTPLGLGFVTRSCPEGRGLREVKERLRGRLPLLPPSLTQ